MTAAAPTRRWTGSAVEERAFLKAILDFVTRNGPTVASEVPGGGKADGGWWGWSRGKMALETLFDQGLVTTATRDGFERLYDIPERVIPPDILGRDTPRESDAIRSLLDLSARAHGIGTEFDLRDYFRLPVAETKTALMELVEDGTLLPVSVEGWKHAGLSAPRRPHAAQGRRHRPALAL